MRVVFHAPLKPPEHPRPSGDRETARLFAAALCAAGAVVEAAPPFRTYDGGGDAERQRRLAAIGERLARRLIRRFRARPPAERPDAWFTYHLYHKAPDHLGPRVAAALGLRYIVAEASYAPKQRTGRWAAGHAAAEAAIRRADRLLTLSAADAECLQPLVAAPGRIVAFPPFVDAARFAAAGRARTRHRTALAAGLGLDRSEPLLLTVAMMRLGDKFASYRVLADALGRLRGRRWRLLVAGDGPAHRDVARALAPLGGRCIRLGQVAAADLPALYAACDLYVWPAVREAFGVAFLEAQAAGLPVVAGRTGGVPDVVGHGRTGLLVPVGDAAAFAAAVGRLLDAPAARRTLGRRAARRVAEEHDLPVAARRLAAVLAALDGPAPATSSGATPA